MLLSFSLIICASEVALAPKRDCDDAEVPPHNASEDKVSGLARPSRLPDTIQTRISFKRFGID